MIFKRAGVLTRLFRAFRFVFSLTSAKRYINIMFGRLQNSVPRGRLFGLLLNIAGKQPPFAI